MSATTTIRLRSRYNLRSRSRLRLQGECAELFIANSHLQYRTHFFKPVSAKADGPPELTNSIQLSDEHFRPSGTDVSEGIQIRANIHNLTFSHKYKSPAQERKHWRRTSTCKSDNYWELYFCLCLNKKKSFILRDISTNTRHCRKNRIKIALEMPYPSFGIMAIKWMWRKVFIASWPGSAGGILPAMSLFRLTNTYAWLKNVAGLVWQGHTNAV